MGRASERPSPFVKWVGGKGRLVAQLRPLLPHGVERMRHVEPFVGGGAFFFARQPARALLCDVNPVLIEAYLAVRDDLDALMDALAALAATHCSEAYYDVRTRYNQTDALSSVERAAMFIYLNKTCFNGLHRVNRKGHFNVPIGRYKKPAILNAEGLSRARTALQHTDIRCASFEALLEHARPGDFIYFDPPYAPVSATANFTSYAQDGFSRDDQAMLRDVFRALDRRGCKMMLSNSNSPIIRELYDGYDINTVAAPRAINCNARKRGKVTEVVVRNYT